MKKFLNSLVAIWLSLGFCATAQAETPVKLRWRVSQGGIADKNPHFRLNLDGKEVGTLTPCLESTNPNLGASITVAEWFVRTFMPSDQDADHISKALATESFWGSPNTTWDVTVEENKTIRLRGWKGGKTNGKATPSKLQMKFTRSGDKATMQAALPQLKILLQREASSISKFPHDAVMRKAQDFCDRCLVEKE
jgi:hypothetical protein